MLPERKFRIIRRGGVAAAALAVAALSAGPACAAPTLTVLYGFCARTNCTDGRLPIGGLIADAAGNLFGTTEAGGANGGGTVFEIAKTASGYASTATVLYSFCAQTNCTDGAQPRAVLIADAAGNLFGTTLEGGVNDRGEVFEIAKTVTGYASTPTVLYSFCAQTHCTDGTGLFVGLILDAAGNLFGTTLFGGANDSGEVFKIAKTATGYASTPTVLYSFCAQTNCTDGQFPFAVLIADAAGNLFGTTEAGGANGGGTVFEITKTASGYTSMPTVLYNFCAQTNCTDGELPVAGLILDAAGNLFGTTQFGGANSEGTVFEIAKTASGYASTPTVLYSFCAQTNCTDGAAPVAGLILDAAGNLFGTTEAGGANSEGTVFEIAKTASGYASTPTVLYSFCAQTHCTDGAEPRLGGLIADAAGNLFGTTDGGGANGDGTVFELGGSGFVPPFAGTPGAPSCQGKSVSALAGQYRGLSAAAAALGFSSVPVLQNAITAFCAG
jgi:uncharacterized repeat protein (TIGR03803 family)